MKLCYRSDDEYERLLTAIQLCRVDPYTREPDRSALIEVLSEIGGIFPDWTREEEDS